MTALVPELVNMASDPSVTTTQILRRALVVAHRLAVPEIVSWLNCELNGYEVNVPNYRMLRGQLMAHNPYHGLIPFLMKDNESMEAITQHHENQSIPELERISKTDNDHGILVRFFRPSLEQKLMKGMSFPMRPQLQFTYVQIEGIIEKVRNRILEWALDLEIRGILGEGMTFTQQERKMGQEQHYHFGDVSSSQIQIGSNSSNQHQVIDTGGDATALRSVAEALTAALNQSKASGDLADELRAEIATLQAQASSPKPKWEIVKASARSVKAIVEGAAGSVLGELAKPQMLALMAILPS
jgi:hypothetical protein